MMSRLGPIKSEDMTKAQQDFYNSLRAKPIYRAVPDDRPLTGPISAHLRSVELGYLKVDMSRYLRTDGLLSRKLVELATIVVCRLWKADYAYCTHERGALRVGISEDIVNAIRKGRPPDFEKTAEKAVYDFAYQITERKRVDDATYKAAVDELGEATLVELTGLCGHYATTCMTINAFELPIREGDVPLPRN
jgi:4-carboxymuconolactone decarboxylase